MLSGMTKRITASFVKPTCFSFVYIIDDLILVYAGGSRILFLLVKGFVLQLDF